MDRNGLIHKLDWIFSRFIRQRDADTDGYVKCFTCATYLHWLQITCGHYRKRRFLGTRWTEMNCEPQCMQCNGKDDEKLFGKLLDKKYGAGTAEVLQIASQKLSKFTALELKEKILYYESKVIFG
jgi:hypothetical protein